MDWDGVLDNASHWAREVGRLQVSHMGEAGLGIEHKSSDFDLVTAVDKFCEARLIEWIKRAYPGHAILSEEAGDDGGHSDYRWVIDPIDGTANFVRGVPVWATLIALMVGDEVVAGVVSAPALGRRWWASKGGGAFTGRSLLQGVPCRVSGVTEIEDASLSYASIGGWIEAGRGQQFVDLLRDCWRTRAYGDFWSYMLLSEGAVDLAAEPELALHDMAAVSIVVTEAGGRFTNLDGQDGPHGPGAIATNSLLHDEVVERLSPDQE